ncbi:MAG: COX15/CtaA family protein, partial [Rhodoblastus sp.]|nr:COX15/CtaA family protein [Rhodoblastus sp.]
LVLCQVGLGIATLLYSVPLPVALAHQAFAMIVLGMVIVNARAAFPARA